MDETFDIILSPFDRPISPFVMPISSAMMPSKIGSITGLTLSCPPPHTFPSSALFNKQPVSASHSHPYQEYRLKNSILTPTLSHTLPAPVSAPSAGGSAEPSETPSSRGRPRLLHPAARRSERRQFRRRASRWRPRADCGRWWRWDLRRVYDVHVLLGSRGQRRRR